MDTVSFVARLEGVRRSGLTEFQLTGVDMDHNTVVTVPEWAYDRFALGERWCVTVSRLDAPEVTERPAGELLGWVEAHAYDLGPALTGQLREVARRVDERVADELAGVAMGEGADAPDAPMGP